MYPFADPTSQLGQLSSELNILKQEVHRKADDHEIHTIKNDLDRLKRLADDINTSFHEFSYQLQVLQEDKELRDQHEESIKHEQGEK